MLAVASNNRFNASEFLLPRVSTTTSYPSIELAIFSPKNFINNKGTLKILVIVYNKQKIESKTNLTSFSISIVRFIIIII